MKKVEKWIIEEKAKKAAFEKASANALIFSTPPWILICALVIFARVPALLAIAFFAVVWLTIF